MVRSTSFPVMTTSCTGASSDGTSTSGLIAFVPANNVYSVSGSHTYATAGNDSLRFTVKDVEKKGVAGLKYDADADKKSWDAMLKLFKETLK